MSSFHIVISSTPLCAPTLPSIKLDTPPQDSIHDRVRYLLEDSTNTSLESRLQAAIDVLSLTRKSPLTLSDVCSLLRATKKAIPIPTQNLEVPNRATSLINALTIKILRYEWTFTPSVHVKQQSISDLSDAIIRSVHKIYTRTDTMLLDPPHSWTIARIIDCYCDEITTLHGQWITTNRTRKLAACNWMPLRASFHSYSRVLLVEVKRLYEQIEVLFSRETATARIQKITPYIYF